MMDKKQYKKYVENNAPKSKHLKTMLIAFAVGGLICCVGQAVHDIFFFIDSSLEEQELGTIVTMIMILFGSILTGFGVYDKIGYYAGAGSIIPITGFANSVVSPAMEFSDEGAIYGIMSHLFAIAGPIIVSGTAASVLVGVIYLIFGV